MNDSSVIPFIKNNGSYKTHQSYLLNFKSQMVIKTKCINAIYTKIWNESWIKTYGNDFGEWNNGLV